MSEFKPHNDNKVIVIGNVPLSDKRALLSGCPDFAIFSKLGDEKYNVEVLANTGGRNSAKLCSY